MRDPSFSRKMMAGSLWYDGELEAQESAMPLDDQITGQNNVYSRMEHEAGALNCWAPEIIYDKSIDGYMIFWATTIPGRFESGETTGDDKYNHRLYYTITKDFKAFSPTQLLYDEGFNVIDATIVKKDDKYLSFERSNKKPVKKAHPHCSERLIARGYKRISMPITPEWVMDPVSKIAITGSFFRRIHASHVGAVAREYPTLGDWTDAINFPEGTRHGSVFKP